MTSHKLAITAVLVGLAGAMSFAQPADAARMKCWKNNEGVTECGNTVPPEYAQKGHTEKTKSGLTKSVTKRAKTKEEIAQEEAEKAKRKAEEREAARLKAEQAERDRLLRQTYTTEEDIVLVRNGKLAAIDSRIKHTRQIIASLETSLTGMQKKAAKQERGGKKVDDKLMSKIKDTKEQITANNQFIADREAEIESINRQFDADVTRWRELKGS